MVCKARDWNGCCPLHYIRVRKEGDIQVFVLFYSFHDEIFSFLYLLSSYLLPQYTTFPTTESKVLCRGLFKKMSKCSFLGK